jgi:SSS family solute:Na+ symporter
MVFTTEHLIGLIITLVIVTAVGIGAARKVKTAADFAVGGHGSGMSLVVGTIIGTIIGGASTIGTAQLAFTVGLSAWWFTLGAGVALLALAAVYAGPLRQSGLKTIPEYLAANYGSAAGPVTSVASSLGIFFSIVANILAATPLVAAIFQFDAVQSAALVSGLTIAYVFFGGVWGAGWVGLIKTGLIYASLLAVGLVTCREMGGLNGFMAAFPAYPWFSLWGRGIWVDMGAALSLLVGTLSTQTYIQAVYAAKDVRTARLGAVMAAVITLPSGIPAVMAGMFMRVHHPDIAPINALPLFIVHYLPPWFGGVAMATLLLAAVGSAAGLALGVSTMLSRDIPAAMSRTLEPRRELRLNRTVVLVVVLLAALLTFSSLKSLVLEWNFLSMGLRGAGIFLPLTAAVLWPGAFNKRAAVWAMTAGTVTALGWKVVFSQGLDPLYAGMIVSALCLGLGYRRGAKKAAGM